MKKSGRIALNVGDPHNGKILSHVDISHFMVRELNYLSMANIVWEKSQISNRLSWGSWCSASSPSFPKSFEYIMIFAKETLKLEEKGETDLLPEEFKKWAISMWKIAPDTKMKELKHPATFPLALPYRLIKMLSWKNATVLDPFNGAGTTGVACKKLGRKYIGIEISQDYIDISLKRINKADEQNCDIFEGEYKIKINKNEPDNIFE